MTDEIFTGQHNSTTVAEPYLGDRLGCGLFFAWNS